MKKIAGAGILIILVVLCLQVRVALGQPPDGPITQAIADLSKAIELSPNSANLYYQRASIYYKAFSRDHDSVVKLALPDLNQAIKFKPDYQEAYLLRAEINSDSGLLNDDLTAWKASEADYTLAIKYGANTQKIYQARGYANLTLKNYAQSAADSRKALEFPSSDASRYIQKNLDEALRLQAAATQPSADKSRELTNRARGEVDTKQYDQAISDATAAIAIDPKNAYAYAVRGVGYIGAQRYEAAIGDLTKTLELDPGNVIAYYNRAVANQYLDRVEATIDDYQQVIDLAPNNDPNSAMAQNSQRAYANSVNTDPLVSIINARISRVNDANHQFIARAVKQAETANSKPTQAAACQSLNELIPFLNDYKTALHRTYFIRGLNAGTVDNLASIVSNIQKKDDELHHDEKTVNDQKAFFKCQL